MPIEFGDTELTELTPKIAVIGVGGAGCNAVNNMIAAELQGVDFVVANTDAQSLTAAQTDNRMQLGVEITKGLGAGAQPKVGEAAAEESVRLIDETLDGFHMVFITAGMGGGTGTGAAPVIAQRAREKGILTVGVVTKPFMFEGGRRMKIADAGIAELAQHVDTLIIIPNQNLFLVANERTTFADAFNMADDVLLSGVRGVSDLMVVPGLINLDFADVRTVMTEMGKAMMGTGEAEGDSRAVEAASAAISNPLLEEASLRGAKGVIINVTGGYDMTLYEVDEAVNMVREQVDPEALIVFGSAFSQDLEGKLRVSVVATGIEGTGAARVVPKPVPVPEPTPAPQIEEPEDVENTETVDGSAEVANEEEQAAVTDEISEPTEIVADAPTVADPGPEPLAANDTDIEDMAVSEPEIAPESLEDQAVRKQGKVFVAEQPMEPKARMDSLNTAQPAQQEAYAGPEPSTPAPEPLAVTNPVEPPRKKTLFEKMASGLRGGEAVEQAPRRVEEPPVSSGAAESSPTADSEQLEIPSFLRRQKN